MTDIRVPFLDLRVQDDEERTALLAAIEGVLKHGRIILGPEVEELESGVATYVGRRHAVGVGSGTDALILGLRSLGLGPGDEVITTPLSFIATANAIRIIGAEPVFADIGDDLNIDPATIEPLIGPKTKAIVPVHWAGLVCDMDEIGAIAKRHGLLVFEDCSQAFGARRNGKVSGSWGDAAGFSMNSMKGLASLGEAGMVVTDDAEIADRLRALRYNGLVNREYCHFMGHNGRLDTVQAAALIHRLKGYDAVLRRRNENSDYYDSRLSNLCTIPARPADGLHAYYTYTIRTGHRDELMAHLQSKGIETKIQHDPLMPAQPDFKGKYRGDFPVAAKLIQEVLCLPANEKITPEQREFVAQCVCDFLSKKS